MSERRSAVVHVDVDGLVDIARFRGWPHDFADDSVFESGVANLLELFDEASVKATFFVIADSLDQPRKLDLLREVVARGHEIASHSLSHPGLHTLDSDRKRQEISESRKRLESELGVRVRGFRAPGYFIDRECLELLEEYGYEWDSSVFPTAHYAETLGVPVETLELPGRPFPNLGLAEVPLPDHRPSPFPVNPSYSLLLGLPYFRWGLGRAVAKGRVFTLLFHLIDAADPVPTGRVPGLQGRIFTLSVMSARRKRKLCGRMLAAVQKRFQVTTTTELLGLGEQ